jgi:hypothetical protein
VTCNRLLPVVFSVYLSPRGDSAHRRSRKYAAEITRIGSSGGLIMPPIIGAAMRS